LDYICNIVGNLSIKEINLELSHMEIIDLSSEDFKASPRLREALRNKEIIPYNASKHKNAKKIKQRNNFIRTDSSIAEITDLKKSLESISNRMLSVGDKLDKLIDKLTDDHDKLFDSLDKFLENKKNDDNKLNCLIEKIDSLLGKGNILRKESEGGNGKHKKEDLDMPIFIPKLDENIYEKNIKSEEILAEGTDNILQKLKNLKR